MTRQGEGVDPLWFNFSTAELEDERRRLLWSALEHIPTPLTWDGFGFDSEPGWDNSPDFDATREAYISMYLMKTLGLDPGANVDVAGV